MYRVSRLLSRHALNPPSHRTTLSHPSHSRTMQAALKAGWGAGRTFSLAAKSNDNIDNKKKKSGVRLSKKDRRVMVESFIKTYQKLNNGSFPTIHVTHKEVGGSYYIVREIVRDIIQENRVLAPPKDAKKEHNLFSTVPSDYPFGSISMEPQVSLNSLSNGLRETSTEGSTDKSAYDDLHIGMNVSAEKTEELVKEDPVLTRSLVRSLDDSDEIKVEETDEQKELSMGMISEISEAVKVETFPLDVSVKISESEDEINLNSTSFESVPEQSVLDSVTPTISPVDQNVGQSHKESLSDQHDAKKISVQSPDTLSNIEVIDTDVNDSKGQKVIIEQNQELDASEPVVSSNTSTVANINGTSSESVMEYNMQEVSMGKNDTLQSGKNRKDDPTVNLSEQDATMRKDQAVQGSSDPHKDRKPTLNRMTIDSWEEISKKPAQEDNPFTGFVKACMSAFSKLFSK